MPEVGADLTEDVQSVEALHLAIDDDQIERTLLELRGGLVAVGGVVDLEVEASQQRSDVGSVIDVVIDDEGSEHWQAARVAVGAAAVNGPAW